MRKHVTWLVTGCLLSVPTLASADATGTVDIQAEAALEVDILLALDLPFAAHEARASGISEAEVSLALESAHEGGVSAAEATEIVTVEVEETKREGKPKDNFGQWVRAQVAAGVRGKELAEAIRQRKAELAAAAPAEKKPEDEEKIKEKLAKEREKRLGEREKMREKRAELQKDGRKCSVKGKEEHDRRHKELADSRKDLLARGKALAKGEPQAPARDQHARKDPGAEGEEHRSDRAKEALRAVEEKKPHDADRKPSEKAKEKKAEPENRSADASPARKPNPAGATTGATLNLKAKVAASSKGD